MIRALAAIFLASAALALAGCGQKGPLRMPAPPAPAPTSPPAAP